MGRLPSRVVLQQIASSLAVVLLMIAASANNEYPVSNGYHDQVIQEPHSYSGQLLAYEGRVSAIVVSENSLIYLTLDLGETYEPLTVPTLFGKEYGYKIRKNQTVRILGMFSPINKEAEDNSEMYSEYRLIGFCLRIEKERIAIFHEDGFKQCEAWANGHK